MKWQATLWYHKGRDPQQSLLRSPEDSQGEQLFEPVEISLGNAIKMVSYTLTNFRFRPSVYLYTIYRHGFINMNY